MSLSKPTMPKEPQSDPSSIDAGRGETVDLSAILTGRKLAVVFGSILLSVLLIALDQTILATALPKMASDFNAFSLQGWVSSSFVLTQTAFILVFGQITRIYPAKWTLLTSIGIFEVGSLICGVSPDVYVLIVGRAISGVGAAGIFISMIQVLSQVTLLETRPKLFGFFGAVFGLASIIGPLLGGALTDRVTWRWCFYINLPFGAVTVVAVTFLLKSSPPLGSDPNDRSARSILRQTVRMDWLGGLLILGVVTSLVLALQWGGNEKPYKSAPVIVCFVLAGVLSVVLILWQRFLGDRAMIPLKIFKSFSIFAIIGFAFMTRFSMLLLTYYIPLYYQAGRGRTAEQSGVNLLPLMLATVVTTILSGQIVGRIGRYWPFLVIGPCFVGVGSGLLYSTTENSSGSAVIGYQILCGVGIGMTLSNSLFAMQAEFRDNPKLLTQATGMATFGQFLGGTVGLAVGETIFSSQIGKNLATFAPTAPAALVTQSPAYIYSSLPADLIAPVVHAFVESLKPVFISGVPAAGISIILALFIKNISISKEKPPPSDAKAEDGLATGDKDMVLATGESNTPIEVDTQSVEAIEKPL